MENQTIEQIEQSTLPETEQTKKEYEPPKIIYRAPLEAMAANCHTAFGKAGPVQNCGTRFS